MHYPDAEVLATTGKTPDQWEIEIVELKAKLAEGRLCAAIVTAALMTQLRIERTNVKLWQDECEKEINDRQQEYDRYDELHNKWMAERARKNWAYGIAASFIETSMNHMENIDIDKLADAAIEQMNMVKIVTIDNIVENIISDTIAKSEEDK